MKKLISIVLALMTIVGLMIPVFAGAEGTENTTMWVNCADGKRLNVRESVNGKLLYRLECGTKVEIQSSVAAPSGWALHHGKEPQEGRLRHDQVPGQQEARQV